MEDETSSQVRVPAKLFERLAALGVLSGLGLGVYREWFERPSSALFLGVVAATVLGGLGAWLRQRPQTLEVRVDATHVHLVRGGRRRSFALTSLAHAEVAHRKDGGSTLRVLDHGHGVLFALDTASAAEVEQWIRRFGLDRGARELAVHGRMLSLGETETRALAGAYLVLALANLFSLSSMSGSITILFPLALFSVWRGRLLVGVDGVEERRLGRRRFHAMAEISDVEKEDKKIRLVMRDGRKVELAVSDKSTDAGARDDIEWTIRRALIAHREARSELALEGLARGHRDVSTWLADLDALARGGDYRQGALSMERLAATVADPTVDASARAAAAWILTRVGKPEAAREARTKAAHPKVRVALDAAMGGDVVALDHATRQLEATMD